MSISWKGLTPPDEIGFEFDATELVQPPDEIGFEFDAIRLPPVPYPDRPVRLVSRPSTASGLRSQSGEEDHLTYVGLIGEEHHQPVDTDPQPSGRW